MNVLAKVNAQIAALQKTVSPACQVAYIGRNPPEEGPPMLTELYPNGQDVPADFNPGIRMNDRGLDLLDMSRSTIERFQALAEHHASSCGPSPRQR